MTAKSTSPPPMTESKVDDSKPGITEAATETEPERSSDSLTLFLHYPVPSTQKSAMKNPSATPSAKLSDSIPSCLKFQLATGATTISTESISKPDEESSSKHVKSPAKKVARFEDTVEREKTPVEIMRENIDFVELTISDFGMKDSSRTIEILLVDVANSAAIGKVVIDLQSLFSDDITGGTANREEFHPKTVQLPVHKLPETPTAQSQREMSLRADLWWKRSKATDTTEQAVETIDRKTLFQQLSSEFVDAIPENNTVMGSETQKSQTNTNTLTLETKQMTGEAETQTEGMLTETGEGQNQDSSLNSGNDNKFHARVSTEPSEKKIHCYSQTSPSEGRERGSSFSDAASLTIPPEVQEKGVMTERSSWNENGNFAKPSWFHPNKLERVQHFRSSAISEIDEYALLQQDVMSQLYEEANGKSTTQSNICGSFLERLETMSDRSREHRQHLEQEVRQREAKRLEESLALSNRLCRLSKEGFKTELTGFEGGYKMLYH
ncbi:unnamed protein product [Calicophoron daubneyi]|uniref:Uncharacterized protein n=1 Tax=Calicophoron daubneyi TaxID=300641 RepID=A0AAV2T7A7_CALDB